MDPTAERPQSPEIEKVPSLRIGFLGSNAMFLGIKLQDQMGQDKVVSINALDYKEFKKKIKQLRERSQDIPQIVVTDKISPKEAEELNSQGISIIVLDQKRKDYSYLTSENPQRKVKNRIIAAASIDAGNMGILLPEVLKAIKDLTQ